MTEQEEKDLIAEAKRLYYKQYREKNKEKIKARQERFWLNKAYEMRSMEMLGETDNKET